MRPTGSRSDSAAHTSSTHSGVTPASSAAVPAAWITGPSASGSENGTPSSTKSAPASAQASPISLDSSSDGKPPIRYGMSAARLPLSAKAAAMRSATQHLGQVLVAAAGQRDQVELAFVWIREDPGEGARGLERRDDAL